MYNHYNERTNERKCKDEQDHQPQEHRKGVISDDRCPVACELRDRLGSLQDESLD